MITICLSDNGFYKSAYTIENKFADTLTLTVDDLPLEFIALARQTMKSSRGVV